MIYNRVALLRADAGLSRQQLAERIGAHYQTVGFIERGDYLPSLELAFAVARAFCVNLEAVFSDQLFESLITNIQGDTSHAAKNSKPE